MFAALFNVIAPVLICIALGYGWGRTPSHYATEFVTRVITNIAAPCLVVATINGSDMVFDEFVTMAGYTVLILAISTVLGLGVLKLLRMDPVLVLPMAVPNVGNMGLPLCYFAFGEQGLALALVIFVVTTLIHFVSGDMVLSRGLSHRQRLALLFRLPLVYATLVAVFLVASGARLPAMAANTVDLLGGMTIPLMLITLGVSLARLDAGNWRQGLLLATGRLAGGVMVALGVILALGVEGLPAKILILQFAMPAAVFNYLFALKHDRSPGAVASAVVISTALSLVLVPVMLWLMMET